MIKRIMMMVAAAMMAIGAALGDNVVSEVTAKNLGEGLIEIGYTLGTIETEKPLATKVTLTDKETGKSYTAQTFTTEPTYEAGRHTLIWNASADGVEIVSARACINVTVDEWKPLYMVIDLSAGANASNYPISGLDEAPAGGWTDEYKTTKLVMRRCPAGKFVNTDWYGGEVTLTKDFYAGVFEVTQKQWNLVVGTSPSSDYGVGDAYPVYYVSYNDIRGSSEGSRWPDSSAVDATSFIGKLRAKTGLSALDLPTEAQWEYACRAGTTTTYNTGDSKSALSAAGWYYDNAGGKTHPVGQKTANAWGLYDMHGNVLEWCLDRFGAGLSGTDPVGAASGSLRYYRGGSWYYHEGYCPSSRRDGSNPSSTSNCLGFRLFCSAGSSDNILSPFGYGDSVEFAVDTISTETHSTIVPVPYEWLDKYRLAETTDYESAANALSGKKDAFGRNLPVYADYVAGTNPTNVESRLEVAIEMKADGTPEITWEPNLGAERKYTIYGAKTLGEDCKWEKVEKGQEGEYRFFNVSVELIGK